MKTFKQHIEEANLIYDKSKLVINKKNKRGVGEIYKLPEGHYGFFHYVFDFGAEGHDDEKEALDHFHDFHSQQSRKPVKKGTFKIK